MAAGSHFYHGCIADENWRTLGLADVARPATRYTVRWFRRTLVGYLQVSHHQGGPAAFSAEELRLMNILGNQAATIIQNALLVRQARSRAQRSDALRHIASLSASSATLDEILKYSVQELARLFQADASGIFLLDEDLGQLAFTAPRFGVCRSTWPPLSASCMSMNPITCRQSPPAGSLLSRDASALTGAFSRSIDHW
jgi:GAF domain-containing protein